MMKKIHLSDLVESLELLKSICSMNGSCTTCCLYDPEERETACLLVKTEDGSLAETMEAAKEKVSMRYGCVMPESPYCPACEHGLVIYPEDTMPGEPNVLLTKWQCLYDPELEGD